MSFIAMRGANIIAARRDKPLRSGRFEWRNRVGERVTRLARSASTHRRSIDSPPAIRRRATGALRPAPHPGPYAFDAARRSNRPHGGCVHRISSIVSEAAGRAWRSASQPRLPSRVVRLSGVVGSTLTSRTGYPQAGTLCGCRAQEARAPRSPRTMLPPSSRSGGKPIAIMTRGQLRIAP
jgi:hypothetical protein